jgi:hypothetical protein
MNSRSPIGRALHMGYMRIVRSVAASFLNFFLLFLREVGILAPVFIVFIVVFTLGMFYADHEWLLYLSELTSRGSELNQCAAFLKR